MTKLIFQDIDGCLNSENFFEGAKCTSLSVLDRPITEEEKKHVDALNARFPQKNENTWLFRLRNIDPAAVALLRDLIEKSGAKIVISSAWRKLHPPSALGALLTCHGLQEDVVIGDTPHFLEGTRFSEIVPRGHEIRAFLEEYEKRYGEVSHFVILDDDHRMAMLRPKLVQTDPVIGLTEDHVRRALVHLGVDP